jgi:hypothetical protein
MTASILFLALLLAPSKATISGSVVDSITGEPLTKVQVLAEPVSEKDPTLSTVTDVKGNFTLAEIDPGSYKLFRAPQRLPQNVLWSPPDARARHDSLY